jgi:hypothetical protein
MICFHSPVTLSLSQVLILGTTFFSTTLNLYSSPRVRDYIPKKERRIYSDESIAICIVRPCSDVTDVSEERAASVSFTIKMEAADSMETVSSYIHYYVMVSHIKINSVFSPLSKPQI